MPDPDRMTISATQTAGLFGVSPYVTKWMLYQLFKHGVDIDPPEDSRMSWGKLMQPLILAKVAEEQKLEVIPDPGHYVRNGEIGCTRDAVIIAPDLGHGALEIKCVFDYGVWMRDWDGGKTVPKQHEIQLQQQMLVGDGADSFKWGMIAVWVCGEIKYFRREPIPEIWERILAEAALFFEDVRDGKEPAPFGLPMENEWLIKLIETKKHKMLDWSQDPRGKELANDLAMLKRAGDEERVQAKIKSGIRTKILMLAGDCGFLKAHEGVMAAVSMRHVKEHMRKASTSKSIKVIMPGDYEEEDDDGE